MIALLEYGGYWLYSFVARIFPVRILYRVADGIGYMVSVFTGKDCRRRAAIIRKIYGERITVRESAQLVRRNMQFFNRELVDFFRAGRLSRDELLNMVYIDGLCYLDEALKKGRGVILVSAHLSSWEMAGITLALRGYPIYGMVWDSRNKPLAGLMNKIRLKSGLRIVKNTSLKTILRLLQKNAVIGIMLDIGGGGKGVPFSPWGIPVRLPRGPAVLSRMSGAEILTGAMLRENDLYYRFKIEKTKMSGTEEKITIDLFSALKKYMEKYPAQWHWIRYFFDAR